jgi:hypothetical protein
MPRRRVALLVTVAAVIVTLEPAAHASLVDRTTGPGGSSVRAGRTATTRGDGHAPATPSPDDGVLLDVDPTDPRVGRAEVPSSRMPATLSPQRSGTAEGAASLAAPAATTLTLSFQTSGFRLFDLPDAKLPYASGRAPRMDTKPHDSAGVRKKIINGRTYDHPVAQAQWGIANVNSYRATKDAFYLRRAIANGQRLIATRVVVQTPQGPAWFFKYPFDFALHSGTAFTERAPWYSGMAQGLAISLFARLVKADPAGAKAWRTAATAGYRSFLVRPSANAPWVVHADAGQHLWLDEYPVGSRPGQADLTLNGHLFAAFGLYEYHRLTGSADAQRLFDGALTTVVKYLPTFRTPGWLSRYCLAHVVRSAGYHRIHVAQLRWAYQMTHAGGLGRDSELLDVDYPAPTVRGTAALAKGTVVGYKFSSSGAVIGRRTLTLSRGSSAPAGSRARVKGRGIYLTISAGGLRGYAVAEVPGRAYLTGVIRLATWSPTPRTFAYTAKSQLFGGPAGRGVVAGDVAHTDRMVLIGGRLWYSIVDGRNDGSYVLYGTIRTT